MTKRFELARIEGDRIRGIQMTKEIEYFPVDDGRVNCIVVAVDDGRVSRIAAVAVIIATGLVCWLMGLSIGILIGIGVK